jgi:hypothetical protein
MRMSQPGPPGQANTAPWQRWLLPGVIAAFFVTLLVLPRGVAPGTPLTYTRFVADVGAGTVRAVTIGPAGQVTGSLTSGQPFSTTIPVALGGNGLAGDLAAHHVQVTATAAAASSSLLAVRPGRPIRQPLRLLRRPGAPGPLAPFLRGVPAAGPAAVPALRGAPPTNRTPPWPPI